MSLSFLRTSALALAALLLAATQALAQSALPNRVGRLSTVEGAVSFGTADNSQWGPVEFNRPLTSGDRLQTSPGARAELHSGSTALRLAGQTTLEISELDDDTTRLTLTQGSLNLRVRNLYPGERLEVNTPNLAFVANQPGEYRLDVDPGYGTTGVTVRSGSATVYGEDGASRSLGSPQQVRFADRQLAQMVAQNNPPRDNFDLWTAARDRTEDASQSARFVSRDVIGYQQLDQHGDWRTDPNYGAVWFPRVNVGQWAPYRNGQWRWVSPWGWTWVDDAPWGFAPFHYGRWTQIGAQWAWVPGPIVPRPSYAPALVGFPDNRQDHWQDHRRPPTSGWFPLAPGQAGRPAEPARPRPLDNPNGFFNPPQPGMPGNPPGWRTEPPLQAIPMPRPRPDMRPPDMPQQPLPAARNQAELEQRAQIQRQQQADRERAQQDQARAMQNAQEQDPRFGLRRQMDEARQRQLQTPPPAPAPAPRMAPPAPNAPAAANDQEELRRRRGIFAPLAPH